jgi:hypothetical protein
MFASPERRSLLGCPGPQHHQGFLFYLEARSVAGVTIIGPGSRVWSWRRLGVVFVVSGEHLVASSSHDDIAFISCTPEYSVRIS